MSLVELGAAALINNSPDAKAFNGGVDPTLDRLNSQDKALSETIANHPSLMSEDKFLETVFRQELEPSPTPAKVAENLNLDAGNGVVLAASYSELFSYDTEVLDMLNKAGINNVQSILEMQLVGGVDLAGRVLYVSDASGSANWVGIESYEDGIEVTNLDEDTIREYLGVYETVDIKGSRMRGEPSTNSDLLKEGVNEKVVLPRGARPVNSEGYDWYRVKLSDGTYGWIADLGNGNIDFGSREVYFDEEKIESTQAQVTVVDRDGTRKVLEPHLEMVQADYDYAYSILPQELKDMADKGDLEYSQFYKAFTNSEGYFWVPGLATREEREIEAGWVKRIDSDYIPQTNTQILVEADPTIFEDPSKFAIEEYFKTNFQGFNDEYYQNWFLNKTIIVRISPPDIPVMLGGGSVDTLIATQRGGNNAMMAAGASQGPNGEVIINIWAPSEVPGRVGGGTLSKEEIRAVQLSRAFTQGLSLYVANGAIERTQLNPDKITNIYGGQYWDEAATKMMGYEGNNYYNEFWLTGSVKPIFKVE